MIQGIDKYFVPIDIYRTTEATDSFGNVIKVYSYYKTVQGRIRQLGASETYTSDKDTQIYTHRLYLRPDDIRESDEIDDSGVRYAVKTINNVMGFDALYQVDLERVYHG